MTRVNKKKKGSKAGQGERSASVIARRGGPGFFDSLPSFPGPESYDHMLERIIGYEFVSTTDGVPCRVSRDEDGTVAVREVLTGKAVPFSSTLVPNYRGEPEFPVARDLIERVQVDCADSLLRRVKKCIKDVPGDQLDVYTKFMERDGDMRIVCAEHNGDVNCLLELAGKDYDGQEFILQASDKGHSFAFGGHLHTHRLMKYQKELSMLLAYECLARICDGTAVSFGQVIRGSRKVIGQALRSMYTESKRWSDLISFNSNLLNRAIAENNCLDETTTLECYLGEALEAKGLHEQAALVYAEAGRLLHLAKHPKTARLMNNAGLAWKRHGNWENAESYYCLALQSLCLECNHKEYKEGVFNTLNNLFRLYFYSIKSFAPLKLLATLGHLICASGGDDSDIKQSGVVNAKTLKPVFKNASEEQMCRVLQSIIEQATSVGDMRAAILGCCDPRAALVEVASNVIRKGAKEEKDLAREFLQGSHKPVGIGYMASCSACGEITQEKKLQVCVCATAYYCNKECQKDHWPQHKAGCVAARKSKKKAEKKGHSSGGDVAELGVGKLTIE